MAIPNAITGLFQDFQPYMYWTNVEHKHKYGSNLCPVASAFSFNTGRISSNTDLFSMYVLPIIPGNVFGASDRRCQPPPHPQTAVRPSTRPSLAPAGITWLADADLARSKTETVQIVNGSFGSDGSMTHDTAVSWIAAMNDYLDGNPPRLASEQNDLDVSDESDLAGLYQALGLSGQEPVVPVPGHGRSWH